MGKGRQIFLLALSLILLLSSCPATILAQSPNLPSLAQMKAAAERGDANAQAQLGASYSMSGRRDEAAKWYRKAAEQGNVDGQYRLAEYLLSGPRQPPKDKQTAAKNAREAVNWLTKAATRGHPPSQFFLGRCYEGGTGVKADKIEPYKWYRLAALKGTFGAQSALNRLILSFTSEEIAEGQKRADSFVVGQPSSDELRKRAILSDLTLKGITGPKDNRIALINGKSFDLNQDIVVVLNGESVKVRCLEINERSVVVSVNGVAERYELTIR